MHQFIQWGGLTPEQFRAKQQHEIMEARISQAMMAPVAASGGSAQAGTIQFVVAAFDSYWGLYFAGEVTASAQTTATFNWGDGVTETLLIDTNLQFSHTYAEDGEYTVTVDFEIPSLITVLNFYGDD